MTEQFFGDPRLKILEDSAGCASENMYKEHALMNFMADMLREETNADIALYNHGGVRISELPKGRIPLAAVYNIEPFYNRAVTKDMTLDEIAELIMEHYNDRKCGDWHKKDVFPSGMSYTVTLDEKKDMTGVQFSIPKEKQHYRTFKTAMTNFMSSEYAHAQSGQGCIDSVCIADRMKHYLEKNNPLRGDNDARVFGY